MSGIHMMFMAQSSAAATVAIADKNVLKAGINAANSTAGVRYNATGVSEARTGTAYASYETWLLSGAASDYDIRVTLASGTSPNLVNAGMNVWLNLGTSREWSLQDTDGGAAGGVTCALTVEIRNASTLAVLDTASVTLDSDYSLV